MVSLIPVSQDEGVLKLQLLAKAQEILAKDSTFQSKELTEKAYDALDPSKLGDLGTLDKKVSLLADEAIKEAARQLILSEQAQINLARSKLSTLSRQTTSTITSFVRGKQVAFFSEQIKQREALLEFLYSYRATPAKLRMNPLEPCEKLSSSGTLPAKL